MGMAHIDVTVTALGNACRIGDSIKWYVHVLHCDGTILRWCNKSYVNLPTKCGRIEIEVPPGCYMVCATWGLSHQTSGKPDSLGNHISHVATVRLNCDDHACVTLFAPTLHFCGVWWKAALQEQIALGNVTPPKGAMEAIDGLLDVMPVDPLALEMLNLVKERPKDPPRK
jgi:hypothetical protein